MGLPHDSALVGYQSLMALLHTTQALVLGNHSFIVHPKTSEILMSEDALAYLQNRGIV